MKKGWELKRLAEVCEVIAGQSPEGRFYNNNGNGMPFFQGKKDFGEKYIGNPTTWTTQTTKLARKGDLLMSVRAPVGPVNFANSDICIGRGLAAIRCSKEMFGDFLYYQLVYKQPEIAGREGAVFASINKSDIETLSISFTSLPEQRRIVAILDKAFDGIAKTRANAEANLKNARALFESHLNEVFTRKGEGWVEKPLEEVCTKITDGEHIRPKVTTDGVPFLSAKDVLDNDIIFTDTLFVSEADAIKFRKRCDPCFGDILIVSRGASVGRTCIVNTNKLFCLLGSVILLKVKSDISSKYITYALKSPVGSHQLVNLSEASAQQAIYLRDIKLLKIMFPSLRDQNSIVSNFDDINSEIQRLESIYQRKLAALDELKKSLLHQAFNGEL